MNKKHKIAGYDINICCKEQVIAYNYLFSFSINNWRKKEDDLLYIKKELEAKDNGTYEELYHPIHPFKKGGCNYMLVYDYIVSSWDRYASTENATGRKYPIFSNYEDLASVIY